MEIGKKYKVAEEPTLNGDTGYVFFDVGDEVEVKRVDPSDDTSLVERTSDLRWQWVDNSALEAL